MNGHQRRPPGASTFGLLAVAALIAYGSLYPFHFAWPDSLAAVLRDKLSRSQAWTSPGDVAGNVLLFIPLGAAIVVAAGGRTAPWLRVAALAAAVAFSALLQFAQIFVPARSAEWSDVLWNSVGSLIGMALGGALRHTLPRLAPGAHRLAALTALAIAFWLLWRLWPFVPTLDWQQVKNALKPLRAPLPVDAWSFASTTVSVLLLAGLLSAWRHAGRVLLVLAAAAVAARPFLVGQVITPAVLGGSLAGALLGLAALRIGFARAGPAVIALAMLWLSADSLRPFVLHDAAARLHWLPFEALLEGSMDINLAVLCRLAFLTGALALIGDRLRWPRGRWCALLMAWLLLLEIAQLWIPQRTSDLTVVLFPFAWWLALRTTRAA